MYNFNPYNNTLKDVKISQFYQKMAKNVEQKEQN